MSTGSTYKVTPAGQVQAAAAVTTAKNNIQRELDDINSQGKALSAVWGATGSKEAYEARQAKWTSAANDIIQALNAFAGSLHASSDISSSTEKKNTSRMAGN